MSSPRARTFASSVRRALGAAPPRGWVHNPPGIQGQAAQRQTMGSVGTQLARSWHATCTGSVAGGGGPIQQTRAIAQVFRLEHLLHPPLGI